MMARRSFVVGAGSAALATPALVRRAIALAEEGEEVGDVPSGFLPRGREGACFANPRAIREGRAYLPPGSHKDFR
jgi:hypothetical protein